MAVDAPFVLFIFIFIMKTSFSLCSCKKIQQIVFDGEMRFSLRGLMTHQLFLIFLMAPVKMNVLWNTVMRGSPAEPAGL